MRQVTTGLLLYITANVGIVVQAVGGNLLVNILQNKFGLAPCGGEAEEKEKESELDGIKYVGLGRPRAYKQQGSLLCKK